METILFTGIKRITLSKVGKEVSATILSFNLKDQQTFAELSSELKNQISHRKTQQLISF
jgi:phage terminase Nu1 subunit (DNA packaging protein)